MRHLAILPILVIMLVLAAGCTEQGACTDGSGLVVTESRSPGDFSRIDLVIPAELEVLQGDSPALTIEADENVLPLIATTVTNGRLIITYTRPCVRPSQPVRIEATVRDLQGIAILGSGDIKSRGILYTDNLETGITGTGTIDLDVQVKNLTSTITGTGTDQLRGHATNHMIRIPGAGRVDALGLETRSTKIDIIGSGSAEVQVNSSLSVNIIGSGSVLYTGNPTDIQQSVTGSGNIRPL